MDSIGLGQLSGELLMSGRRRRLLNFVTLLACDMLVFLLAGLIGSTFGDASSFSSWTIHLSLFAAWVVWVALVKKAYIQRKPFWSDLWQTLSLVIVFALIDATVLSQLSVGSSRQSWSARWFFMALFIPVIRHLGALLLQYFGAWQVPTLIVGRGENAEQAYLALQSERGMGFDVRAFVWPQKGHTEYDPHDFGPLIDGKQLVLLAQPMSGEKPYSLYHYVIALESNEWRLRDDVIRQLSHAGITDVHVIPAMRGVPLYGMETAHFFSHEVLLIQLRNNLANPLHKLSKRVFDLISSSTLLLLLSPVFAFLIYKVRRDGGNPFFGHVRIGQNGRPFKCYKFRSMVVNAQEVLVKLLADDSVAKAEWDRDFKLKNDPRVSQLGAFLRRSSLDELPQLWNVLMGHMSLVGPRPIVQAELDRYGDDKDYYLMAKPGMTGLWQVSGRNDVDYATRVYLDSWYVKNWSLWSDIAILFKTVSVVTKRSGAY
jgi:UDP-galactose-lipid carrier transferase